jgi:membrane protein required for colicin V production
MNYADYAILAVLGLSVLSGLFRGFVGEMLSLICWIAAFWVAWAFGAQAAAFYAGFIHEPTVAIIAGYVSCFLGVLVVGALVGTAIRKLVRGGVLDGGDRLLGMLFGLARGLLLVTGAVLMLGFTPVPGEASWWRHSELLPGFERGAIWLGGQLPPDVTKYLEMGGKALPALPAGPISTMRGAPDPAPASSALRTRGALPAHHAGAGDMGQ